MQLTRFLTLKYKFRLSEKLGHFSQIFFWNSEWFE